MLLGVYAPWAIPFSQRISNVTQETLREMRSSCGNHLSIGVRGAGIVAENILQLPALPDTIVYRGQAAFRALVEDPGKVVLDFSPSPFLDDASPHDEELLFLGI